MKGKGRIEVTFSSWQEKQKTETEKEREIR